MQLSSWKVSIFVIFWQDVTLAVQSQGLARLRVPHWRERTLNYFLCGLLSVKREYSLCSCNILADTKWPSFVDTTYQVKLVNCLTEDASNSEDLLTATKAFRWLLTTYIQGRTALPFKFM